MHGVKLFVCRSRFDLPHRDPEQAPPFRRVSNGLTFKDLFCIVKVTSGAVAQLGERLNGIQEVEGSTPFGSTNRISSLRPAERRVVFVRQSYNNQNVAFQDP